MRYQDFTKNLVKNLGFAKITCICMCMHAHVCACFYIFGNLIYVEQKLLLKHINRF